MINIKEKLVEYRRVLNVTRRPNKEEYMISSKVTSVGISIIGIIGFIIFLVFILAGI